MHKEDPFDDFFPFPITANFRAGLVLTRNNFRHEASSIDLDTEIAQMGAYAFAKMYDWSPFAF